MKHVFIINPVAGKKSSADIILEQLKEIKDFEYEVHYTEYVNDAYDYTKKLCQENPEIDYRFYACGGDGTVNEVVNGIYGYANASFTVFPCGSGNDFVKAFRGADFKNVSSLVNGEEIKIDAIKANDKYGVNIVNVGFDAGVSYNFIKFKRWPLVSGNFAYILALLYSLFKEMKHEGQIYIDGELKFDGKFLMTSACNGICCGGSFYFAPNAIINDGKLDDLFIKKVSVFKFLRMVKKFKNGTYIDDPKYQKFVSMNYAHNIEIKSKKILKCGIDGEAFLSDDVKIEIIPSALRFVQPKLANENE